MESVLGPEGWAGASRSVLPASRARTLQLGLLRGLQAFFLGDAVMCAQVCRVARWALPARWDPQAAL